MIVGVVSLLDTRPEDPHPPVEAAEFLRKAPRAELVLQSARCRDRCKRDDASHSREPFGKLLWTHQRAPSVVVHGDQDERLRPVREGHIHHIGDVCSLCDPDRIATPTSEKDTGETEDMEDCLGSGR